MKTKTPPNNERYVTKEELAKILSVSVRTIEKNSLSIPGRAKVGRCVRYYLPEIHRYLSAGKNIFRGNR